MNSQTANVGDLFADAHQEGVVSDDSMKLLAGLDMGATIQNALGQPAFESQASEVILLAMVDDDSGSIAAIREDPKRYGSPLVGPELVINGHNLILDSLMKTKQAEAIMVHSRLLNKGILHPFVSLTEACQNYRLDNKNYQPNGMTPLFDRVAETLATVMAKVQEFSIQGIPVRAIVSIVTDGAENDSYKVKNVAQLRALVEDALRTEKYVITAMGIDDGSTDFKTIFTNMGILPEWILTPKNSAHEIRQAYRTVSQSAVRASQAATFSPNTMGGFGGNP